MANRVTSHLNAVLREASDVEDYYSKGYLVSNNNTIGIAKADVVEVCNIDSYYRLCGYELFDNTENNKKVLEDMSKHIVNTIGSTNQGFSLTLYNDPQSGMEVYLGTNRQNTAIVKNAISNTLRNASLVNNWLPHGKTSFVQKSNGLIVGACALELGDIDKVINMFASENYILNILCIPCENQYIRFEIDALNSRLDLLQRASRSDISVGTLRSRRLDNDRHDILSVIDTIGNKSKTRLSSCLLNGAWHVVVHVAANNGNVYRQLSSAVVALFNSRGNAEAESIAPQVIDVSFLMLHNTTWLFPKAFLGKIDFGGVLGNSLVNLLDSATTSTLMLLPLHSHEGFTVRHHGESNISTGAFDLFPPKRESEDSFVFGSLLDGREYQLQLRDFRQHALVTGATQFGKSTTVQHLLIKAIRQGVNFVVIESAKKDYWRLTTARGLNRIPVYSVGKDAKNLYINPFQPEDNTRLDFHIQSLINALLSLFVQDDPLPQIITNLVYLCYEKEGWDTSQRVYQNESKKYPVLSDMLVHLHECINAIGYSDDVKNDMIGVVTVRISSLIRQVGNFFNTQRNISIKDMFNTSAIIELDDFDDVSRPFIASLIAIKANEYTRQCCMESKLQRLLVIEEAHHILPNPELRSSSPNSLRCSNYFSNMLAEVSAYGTGIVIVDQRASAVSSTALANTGVKIVHNIRQGDDIEAVSLSMNLKEHEQSLLNKLSVGQAIISLPQVPEICRVNVHNKKEPQTVTNIGCLMCEKNSCGTIGGFISPHEDNYIANNGINQSNLNHCIESIEGRHSTLLSKYDKVCLVGRLISKHSSNILIGRQDLYAFKESLIESEENDDESNS